MKLLRILRQRARSLFRGTQVDAELARELEFHLELLTRENMAAGMSAREARLAARRTLGGVALIEDQCRDHRRIGWFTDFSKDVVFSWRMLRKSPGFTALAVATLACGVGAGIAVYALAESLLMRSLPYPAPERLTAIYSVHVRRGNSEAVGQDNFLDWQRLNTVFERMAYTEYSQVTLTGLGDAERITGLEVSEGFFEMLGVQPLLGRWFTAEEQKPGGEPVVMVSHGFWVTKLGARPDVAGSIIVVNDRPWRITGVMPATFHFAGAALMAYWTPLTYRNSGRKQHQYLAYGRLKPGLTLSAAQTQMSAIARRLEQEYPDNAGWGVRVASLRDKLLKSFGAELKIFSAAALIVILVGCANVASLLLARGVGRRKEIAVRVALGAGRRRVVRLLLTESLLLASLGSMAGLAVAAGLIRLAIVAAPPSLPLGDMVSVSPTLVAFMIGLTLLTGVLTGLWAALRGARANLQDDLKESGCSLVAGRQHRLALDGLVLVEIALAVVLLTFAGLLARSFAALLQVDLGYRPDHLLTFRISPPSSRYRDNAARLWFWNSLLPRLAVLPGVVSAGAASGIPLGGTYSGNEVRVEGRAASRDWTELECRTSIVTAEYFQTMGIPLRQGRGFTATDTLESEPVILVNQEFVRLVFPGSDPIGKHVHFGDAKWMRIVGVVGDHRYHGPAQPVEAEAYAAFTQASWLQFVVLRTAVPEQTLMSGVRAAIRAVDSSVPLTQVRTMEESLHNDATLPREMTILVAGFAAITLAMATMGLAGVMAYSVSRRRREIGLRMALGARAGDVSRAVMGSAGRLVLAGSALGLVGAYAASRLLESMLYGVRPHDPVVFIAAPVVLGVVALAASMWPARQAASVEPMAALRQE